MPNYLVIARKWRPGLFEEIIGQEHVTRTLSNAITSGRVAHAYLFSGPRGVGKTTAARILAKGLNCSSGPTPEPCNTCSSCAGIASGSSVDVFEIDGASNNSVENVRDLTEGIRYMPGQGRYKVYIIDEVHMLSGAAFNALLKTLEEPPPHAVFIFATTEAHKIPATILSRCQRFDFRRIPFREIQKRLAVILEKEGIRFEEGALFTIARESDGSLRDAQSLLDQVLAFSGGDIKEADVAGTLGLMDRTTLFELAGAVLSKDGAHCLNVVEKIYNFGYDLKRASAELLELIRDITVLKVTGDAGLLEASDSEVERMKALSSGAGEERLHMLFSIISRGYEEVSRSAYPRYSFEMALLKAAHFDEVEPVSELIERLERLNRASAAGKTGGEARRAAPWAGPPDGQRPPAPAKDASAAPREEGAAGNAKAGAASAQSATIEGLAGYLREKIVSLSGLLQTALIRDEGDAVEITVAADKCPVLEIKRKEIEAASSEYMGRRVKAVIKAGAEAPGKKNQPDPVLKEALKVLGGKVIEDTRRTNV